MCSQQLQVYEIKKHYARIDYTLGVKIVDHFSHPRRPSIMNHKLFIVGHPISHALAALRRNKLVSRRAFLLHPFSRFFIFHASFQNSFPPFSFKQKKKKRMHLTINHRQEPPKKADRGLALIARHYAGKLLICIV